MTSGTRRSRLHFGALIVTGCGLDASARELLTALIVQSKWRLPDMAAATAEEHTMSKVLAVLGSALFFVIAPLVLAGFVPWWVTQWEFRPAFFGVDLTRILGGILIIVGVPGLVDSFARFALEGLGTPAPIAPTQKLVVTGLYRYMRNPIYIAVVAVIFG